MKVLDMLPAVLKHDRQRVLSEEIGRPNRTLVIIRGDSPEVAKFAAMVSKLTESVSWREVIWIRDGEILHEMQEPTWFGNDQRACAVVLNLNHQPVGLLYENSSRYEVEIAFLEALRISQADSARHNVS